MTIQISEDALTETQTHELSSGGSVHDMTRMRAPEELAVPLDAELERATGEVIRGAQWMTERAEMRAELAGAGCKDKKGNLVMSRSALNIILTRHPYWRGAIRFNELLSITECAGERVDGTFTTRVLEWFERRMYHRNGKKGEVEDAIDYVARTQKHHPVRDYLNGLPAWDGIPRIENLVRVLGAKPLEDWDLYQAYLRVFFVGAVKRALEPGCQFDTMLVLLGPQGAKKTTFWRTLAGQPPLYNSLPSKKWDDIYTIHGSWVHEYAELEGVTTRSAVDALKAHLTTLTDSGALKYERQVTYLPRACVFVASTNEADALLRDHTGNRRFHIIRTGDTLDIDYVREHRDQLWAEAIAMLRDGAQPYLTDDRHVRAQAEVTEQYVVEDPWHEPIAAYVTRHLFDDIRVPDILKELDVEKARQTKADEMRVGNILRELGFDRVQRRVGADKVRVWARIKRD